MGLPCHPLDTPSPKQDIFAECAEPVHLTFTSGTSLELSVSLLKGLLGFPVSVLPSVAPLLSWQERQNGSRDAGLVISNSMDAPPSFSFRYGVPFLCGFVAL